MNEVADLLGPGEDQGEHEDDGGLKHLKLKVLGPLITGVVKEGSYEALGQLMRRIVMVGAMHFMDGYNFDLERVERCGIHYAIPDGRLYHFVR